MNSMAGGAVHVAVIRANMTMAMIIEQEIKVADPEHVKTATETLDDVRRDWMSRQGVISIEVARRWIDGVPTDQVGIRVTVEKLLPSEQVPAGEVFPEDLQGVPVDLVEGAPPVPE